MIDKFEILLDLADSTGISHVSDAALFALRCL